MKKTDVPCYGCENREVGCHSKCEKYKEYKEVRNEEYSKREKLFSQDVNANLPSKDRSLRKYVNDRKRHGK